MSIATEPKTFALNLEAGAQGVADPGLHAALVLGQVMRCIDLRFGEGGRFSNASDIHPIQKDPNPSCIGAWAFEAYAVQPGFSIKLTPMIYVFRDGSSPFHMDFEDVWGWQKRDSEALVGHTMKSVDRKLSLLFKFPPGKHWLRTYGQWKHGVFFDG